MTILGLADYVWKTVTRARMRSALTLFGVVVSMVLFGFVRGMDSGMTTLREKVNRADMLLVFERNTFCPFQTRIPQRYATEIAAMPGVQEVLPVKMYMNNCRANLDLITLYGIPAAQLDSFFPHLGVTPGQLAAFKNRDNAALIGSRVAARRGLKPGDQVMVGEVIAHIVGDFDTDGSFLDNVIFLHLDHLLQSIPGGKLGSVTQHLVRLAPNAEADALAKQIDERFMRDEAPTKTRPLGEFVNRTLGEISAVIEFAQLLGYAAVVVMALILANTVFMSAQARRAEFAVLQVVGVTRPGIIGLILAESLVLAIFGAILGLGGIYAALTLYPMGVGVEGYQVDFLVSSAVLLEGAILAVAVGLGAGIGPAIQAGFAPVGNALRPE